MTSPQSAKSVSELDNLRKNGLEARKNDPQAHEGKPGIERGYIADVRIYCGESVLACALWTIMLGGMNSACTFPFTCAGSTTAMSVKGITFRSN